MANEPKTTADYLAAMVKHQRETLDATKSIDKTVRSLYRALCLVLGVCVFVLVLALAVAFIRDAAA